MKWIFILIIINIGCKTVESQSITQGIKGQTLWLEGNQMPSPGVEPSKGEPVVRQVYICTLTKRSQVSMANDLFIVPEDLIIKIVTSDEQGKYSCDLAPGTYSVLTKEEDGLFANIFDGENNINPVKVVKGEFTEFDITINYKAYY